MLPAIEAKPSVRVLGKTVWKENSLSGVQSDRPDLDEDVVGAKMLDLLARRERNIDHADSVSRNDLEGLDGSGE